MTRFPSDRYVPRNTSDRCPTCGAEPAECCTQSRWGEPNHPVQPHLVAIESPSGSVDWKPTQPDEAFDRLTGLCCHSLIVKNCVVCRGAIEARNATESRLRELIATVRRDRFATNANENIRWGDALSELESLALPRKEP